MKNLRFLLISSFLIISTSVIANQSLIGSWQNNEGMRMDIIDGFKPNVGPVIYWEKDELTDGYSLKEVHTWKIDPNSNELKINWESGVIEFSENNKNLYWETSSWKDREDLTWKKIDDIEMLNVIDLKSDPDAFINQLTSYQWSSSANDVDKVEFTKTFSSTEGVLSEFDNENIFSGITPWGIASGVMKIGSYDLYLEAKISENYLIATDDDDRFLLLFKGNKKEIFERVSLADSREKFLATLTTGAWLTRVYSRDNIYRFRPIEGDLKGRVFREVDSKLISTESWEYSPSTGAFKQSYTEFPSALNIGDILVFIDTNGNQISYYRDKSVEMKEYSLNDVINIPVSERSKDEIKQTLSKQMSIGSGNDFTLFEFNEDNRTGYFHEWKSSPFQITGQTLSIENYSDVEQLYLVEDYVVFDEGWSKKIDTRESRMKPKSDEEANQDSIQAKAKLDAEVKSAINIKIELIDGTSKVIPVPINSISDLKSISIINK